MVAVNTTGHSFFRLHKIQNGIKEILRIPHVAGSNLLRHKCQTLTWMTVPVFRCLYGGGGGNGRGDHCGGGGEGGSAGWPQVDAAAAGGGGGAAAAAGAGGDSVAGGGAAKILH